MHTYNILRECYKSFYLLPCVLSLTSWSSYVKFSPLQFKSCPLDIKLKEEALADKGFSSIHFVLHFLELWKT